MLIPGLAQPIPDGWVTIDGRVYRALIAEEEPEPDPRQQVVVQDRDVDLRWDGKVLRVRATWRIVPKERTWLHLPLASQAVRVDRVLLDGRPADLMVEGGFTRITAEISRPTTLVLEGAVEGDPTRGPLSLQLAGAVHGEVRVRVPDGLEGRLIEPAKAVPVERAWLTTAERISVQVGPPQRKAQDRRTLAVARTGMGLTVGDGAVHGRARVRWTLRQGRLNQVTLRASGVGQDLEVTGSNVGRVERQGDRVVVTLREPVTAYVDLDLRWSVPVPTGETGSVAVPRITPQGAFRTEASLQLARDGTLEVLPEVPGWQPVASADLPDWGDDLVAGTPTAAYQAPAAGKGGTLGLLRFVPAPGPAVVVDVASLTIATSSEGRTLTRALYTVRNERASHLELTPPPGATIVGVRVSDGPVTPVSDGERWLVPLPRSLETVDGLVSFPVEVVLIGDGTPWIRKEARELALPRVNAPIAVNRVTLHLPPTFDNELEQGAAGTVSDFTEGEGIAYGFGLGGQDEARADQLWQDAQSAWMRNDFDEADQLLDELEGIGATNENLGKLRSNLDVVQGRSGAKAKTIQARRVREQAKSRGLRDYRQQEDLLRKAEEELASGEYSQAQQTYEEVEELARKLDKLEQEESFEQKSRLNLAQQNQQAASSGMLRLKALQGQDEERDRREAKEDQRVLDQLVRQAEADGWVTRAADRGEVSGADGVVSRVVEGRQSLDGTLSFVPREGETSEVERIARQLEDQEAAERRRQRGQEQAEFRSMVQDGAPQPDAKGRLEPVTGAVGGDVAGSSLNGGSHGQEIDAGFGGLGVTGSGSGGGGTARTIVMEAPDEVEEEISVQADEQRMPQRVERAATVDSVEVQSGPRGIRIGGNRRSRSRSRSQAAPPPPQAAPRAGGRKKRKDSAGPLADDPAIQFGRDVPADSFDEADDATGMDFDDANVDGDLAVPDAYAMEALQVTSTRLSVVIPVQGQTLRYQHLLLPAGAQHAVRIEARSHDRDIPRRLP